jgi:hypothetical protein
VIDSKLYSVAGIRMPASLVGCMYPSANAISRFQNENLVRVNSMLGDEIVRALQSTGTGSNNDHLCHNHVFGSGNWGRF